MIKWKIAEENDSSALIDGYDEHGKRVYHAQIRFDGCVNLWEGDDSYIHICNIPKFIKTLSDVRQIQEELFGYKGLLNIGDTDG
jgi:hypothetical protein